MKKLLLSLVMLFGADAFAQMEHGNGGGEDVEFHKISADIQVWMKKNLDLGLLDAKLQLNGISASVLYQDFSLAVASTKVKFQDESIMVSGQTRVCRNDDQPNRIVCNRELWNHQVAGNIKYAIVLHEYLGVAKYEQNVMEYSQYPVSKNILDFVFAKEVFELGMDKVKNNEEQNSCQDASTGVRKLPCIMKKTDATQMFNEMLLTNHEGIKQLSALGQLNIVDYRVVLLDAQSAPFHSAGKVTYRALYKYQILLEPNEFGKNPSEDNYLWTVYENVSGNKHELDSEFKNRFKKNPADLPLSESDDPVIKTPYFDKNM